MLPAHRPKVGQLAELPTQDEVRSVPPGFAYEHRRRVEHFRRPKVLALQLAQHTLELAVANL
jgi:hypothetical protein